MDVNPDQPSYEPSLSDPTETKTNASYSAAQRLWMVFTSPAEVFADIRIKPTWVLALILMIALGVAIQFVIMPHIDIESSIRAQLGDRATEMGDEQIEEMVAGQQKFAKFGPIIAIVIGPLAWALMAAIFLVSLKLVGSEMDFVSTLSTALHAYWPPSVVGGILTMILIQRAGMIPQEEVANVVKAHPAAFMSPDSPPWLLATAGTLSIFNIWTVVLLVMGFKIVGGLSTSRATVAALIPWGIWIALKAGLSMIPGLFS